MRLSVNLFACPCESVYVSVKERGGMVFLCSMFNKNTKDKVIMPGSIAVDSGDH